jgi:peptidoglycan/LPS O-acetylase OafA/YrhL
MNHAKATFSHPKYRPDIDGLRAVAVISVVLFHAFPEWLPGGYIGVDIFFVISGFLISTIIFENLERGSFSFLEFYRRRVRRIFPALFLILTACLVFGWFALFADEFRQLGKHVLGGAGFVSNLMLWSESGYFDSASETKPLLHLWSLGIEEQFYLAWPLMVWATWRRKLNLLVLIAAVLGLSLLANLVSIGRDAVATFYAPWTRFWELLAGSLLAWYSLRRRPGNTAANVFSVAGLLLLAGGIFAMTSRLPFPGTWALVPVAGAVLVMLAGPQAGLNRLLLSNRAMVWVGLISFPLYLWHWPVLSFITIVKGKDMNQDTRFIAVTLAVLLAWLTYRIVEQPIRRAASTRSATVLAGLAVAIGAAGALAWHYGNVEQSGASSAPAFTREVREQFVGDKWPFQKNDLCLQQYPMRGLENYAWWFCMKSNESAPTLVLLGNSYANHLYPGFVHNKRLAQHSVLSIGTCDVGMLAGDSEQDRKSPCAGDNYTRQVAFINDLIRGSGSVRFVIIDGLAIEPDAAYIQRVKQRIEFLESTGARVIVFKPHVRPGFDVKSCFSRPLRRKAQDCSFAPAERQKMDEQFRPLVDAISSTNPRVLFFDQNEMYCESGTCAYIRNGMPLYRDKAHLSEYGSDLLQDYFTRWAESNVPALLVSP